MLLINKVWSLLIIDISKLASCMFQSCSAPARARPSPTPSSPSSPRSSVAFPYHPVPYSPRSLPLPYRAHPVAPPIRLSPRATWTLCLQFCNHDLQFGGVGILISSLSSRISFHRSVILQFLILFRFTCIGMHHTDLELFAIAAFLIANNCTETSHQHNPSNPRASHPCLLRQGGPLSTAVPTVLHQRYCLLSSTFAYCCVLFHSECLIVLFKIDALLQ